MNHFTSMKRNKTKTAYGSNENDIKRCLVYNELTLGIFSLMVEGVFPKCFT